MKALKLIILLFVLSMPSSIAARPSPLNENCESELLPAQRNQKLWTVNLTGIGMITLWGVTQWDYFTASPKATSEGWFGNDTDSGGADKLGHVYTSYLATHGISHLYDAWCINKNDAALFGSLSSLAMVTYMEFGDSFSDFGASKEDMAANIVGVVYGYYSYKYPKLANVLDLRWEYLPNENTLGDFTTDYENSKYLLALKLNGFDFSRRSFLRHIEFHTGYYVRGFADPDSTKERNIFVGLGLNLTDFFRRHSYNKTAVLFKYYQLPESSLRREKDINK